MLGFLGQLGGWIFGAILVVAGILLLLFSGMAWVIGLILGGVSIMFLIGGGGWFWFVGIVIGGLMVWQRGIADKILKIGGAILIIIGIATFAGISVL